VSGGDWAILVSLLVILVLFAAAQGTGRR